MRGGRHRRPAGWAALGNSCVAYDLSAQGVMLASSLGSCRFIPPSPLRVPVPTRGKYVPSLGHFILSQAAALGGTRSLGRLAASPSRTNRLAALQRRPLPPQLAAERPLLQEPLMFDLRGLAIGNGLTDPAAQVVFHAAVWRRRVHARGSHAL